MIKGFTQNELADKANVSRSLVVGLETGSYSETSTASLKKLAKALDVKIKDLFF
ncbi:TPA: helix-turn-helix transcriptional regulator [Streptococcus agalactiae]